MISWHRFYDPSTGRYISADPIGLRAGMNLYGYVGGNPIRYIDPWGLFDIYVGGANDDDSGIVSSYQRDNGGANSAYYEWSDSDKILKRMKDICCKNPDEPINLIGHSWGGDTVASIAASWDGDCPINILITIDPVTTFSPEPNHDDIADNTNLWVDVNAKPSNPNASDAIAGALGGKWDSSPAGNADAYYEVDANHENFGVLMGPAKPWLR